MNRKTAVCVGINDYPGSGADLQGCVNDATGWAELLAARGYDVEVLLDSWAVKGTVVSALTDHISRCGWGDRFVFTYSGHGTWLPDRDGDEIDGRDEALCLHDYASGGLLVDDELGRIFDRAAFGARMLTISDSCFSGTMQRFAMDPTKHAPLRQPRFLSPAVLPGVDVGLREAVEAEVVVPRGNRSRLNSGMVLLSGCAEHEVSYDAHIDGRFQGAFSAAMLQAWLPHLTVGQAYARVRKVLPSSEYPQSPQLQTARSWQRYWRL